MGARERRNQKAVNQDIGADWLLDTQREKLH